MKNLILVLPSFFNNSGHENAFINSYKIISIQNKYSLHLIIAENNDLKIPGNIYKIAPKINYNNFFFSKLIKSFFLIFIFFFRLLKFVKKIGKNNKNYYLIDGCSFFYFLSLLLLFLWTGKQTKLLYYLREDFSIHMDKINHFEDVKDLGTDGFIPIEKIERFNFYELQKLKIELVY